MREGPERPHSIYLNGQSWPIFHGIASVFLLLVLLIQISPLASYIETRIAAPLLFQVREMLGKTPPLSSRLKVITLDDSTFSYLGGPRLPVDQLEDVLLHLAAAEPESILIDGLLSDRPDGSEIVTGKAASLPIYSGSFPSRVQLKYRVPIDFSKSTYQLSSYLDGIASLEGLPYSLDQRNDYKIYGHSKSYGHLINGTGHITYNLDGTISAFYQVNDKTVLPHLSLFAADTIKLRHDGLWLDENKVPMSKNGTIVINHRPPTLFYDSAISLKAILKRALAGEPEPSIKKGDVVLVLLAFATGNTDFHEGGPFGEIPGGLMIGSLISDLHQNSWITRSENDLLLILLFGVIGIVLGINARSGHYWMILIGSWIIYSGIVFYAFSYGNLWFAWLLPLIAFNGTSLIHFAHVRIQDEMKLILIEKNYYEEKALRLEEMQKKSELESNLSLGRAVQKLLLPKELNAKFFGFDYEMLYKPTSGLSGDWLYAWDFSLGERRILMGDVMGTGPSAAIPMAMIIGLLNDCEEHRLTLEETINRLNQRLYELFDQQVICTLSALSVHRDGHVEIYNAGGPGWFLSGKNHTEHLTLRSEPIGAKSKPLIGHLRLQLEPQQTLFTFTDGYCQSSKDLKRVIRNLRQLQSPRSSEDIEKFLTESMAHPKSKDDQTLICVSTDKTQRKTA